MNEVAPIVASGYGNLDRAYPDLMKITCTDCKKKDSSIKTKSTCSSTTTTATKKQQ
jgi:hypothetical protein